MQPQRVVWLCLWAASCAIAVKVGSSALISIVSRGTGAYPARFISLDATLRSPVDAEQFIVQRLKAALTRQGAADLLKVSERTVRNWEKRRTDIPYSAYKLLCIEGGYELPGDAWLGFYLRGDTIWSPEGKAFSAHDLAWWSLTCALARERLEKLLQPAAASNQPVAAAPDVPLRAADRREVSADLAKDERPSLQSGPLPAHHRSTPAAQPAPYSGLILPSPSQGGLNERA